MAAMRGVKRREANQTVRADLRAQVAIGVAPANLDGDTFDTSFLTLVIFADLGAEMMALGPTHVHTKQHLRPILGINAAASRVNAHNGIALVMLAVEHQREL